MLACDFQRQIKRLVPNAQIFYGSEGLPAGLYVVTPTGLAHVCGVDKNWVPEFPEWDEMTGQLAKSGWRRAVSILIRQGWVSRDRVRKVWPVFFHGRNRPLMTPPPTPALKPYQALQSLRQQSLEKRGTSDLVANMDEIKGINSMIKKSDAVLESQDRLDFQARKKGIPFNE